METLLEYKWLIGTICILCFYPLLDFRIGFSKWVRNYYRMAYLKASIRLFVRERPYAEQWYRKDVLPRLKSILIYKKISDYSDDWFLATQLNLWNSMGGSPIKSQRSLLTGIDSQTILLG